jgi:hypothetical protein
MYATVQKTLANIAHYHRDGAASRSAVELNPAGATVLLRAKQHMRIPNAAGWTVRAIAGSIWITQDGDIRDVVLEAGDTILLDRKGTVLLSPLGDARVCLTRDTDRSNVQRIAPASVVPLPAVRTSFA